MFEDTNNPLTSENTPQEQSTSQQQEVKKQETEKEYNLRILAERALRAEERARELENYINSQKKSESKPTNEEDDFQYVEDDGYIEGKHFKKYVKSLKNEIQQAKEELKQYSQQSSTSNAELRLKAKYNDFDSVVTRENIEKLMALKPAHYRSIMANPDLYDKGEAAYDLIKNFVATNDYQEQDKRLEENRNKPRSAASAPSTQSDTPLARVGDYDRRTLTQADKDRIMRMVIEAKRNSY